MEYISAGATEPPGYAPEQFHSRSISYAALIHPEERAAVWDTVSAAAQSGQPFGMTYRIMDASGKERWTWEQGKPVFADDEQAMAIDRWVLRTACIQSHLAASGTGAVIAAVGALVPLSIAAVMLS